VLLLHLLCHYILINCGLSFGRQVGGFSYAFILFQVAYLVEIAVCTVHDRQLTNRAFVGLFGRGGLNCRCKAWRSNCRGEQCYSNCRSETWHSNCRCEQCCSNCRSETGYPHCRCEQCCSNCRSETGYSNCRCEQCCSNCKSETWCLTSNLYSVACHFKSLNDKPTNQP
jgi:hypothetical protein